MLMLEMDPARAKGIFIHLIFFFFFSESIYRGEHPPGIPARSLVPSALGAQHFWVLMTRYFSSSAPSTPIKIHRRSQLSLRKKKKKVQTSF